MFSRTLRAELARRIGSRVLLVTDNYEGEGTLMSISGNLISLNEATGYGETALVNLSVDELNFVRILSATV
ncbi:hypothetical protein [Metabacillus fastidiosus]|uniref:hypothetical protein n=1 Tax=Metabacillus fastidiosus TaxID=1458 RepID=UPI002DBF2768|nr:hypothetical protein [Metabacillus fastidiosus]MEC2077070.1 hypothetical protein [Metabacillus fastidiosus]